MQNVTIINGEAYFDFIKRGKSNEISRRVKIADLEDNMDISRIKNPTNEDYERLDKYKRAMKILLD